MKQPHWRETRSSRQGFSHGFNPLSNDLWSTAIGFIHRDILMNMQQTLRTAIALTIVVLLSGCASLPNSMLEKLNDREVELAVTQHGTPPVIFENGLGGRMEWWSKVLPDISRDTTTFAYNRPGYGNSDPAATPRDGLHIVDELRTLLRDKSMQPPYVLVGHSLGGLYMQLYARRYPEDVSALILVDSTHPGSGSL
jgi:hypothetical protein